MAKLRSRRIRYQVGAIPEIICAVEDPEGGEEGVQGVEQGAEEAG